MNLRNEILKEHSNCHTLKIANYVGSSPSCFKLLIDNYLEGPYWVTQRASAYLVLCGALPYINKATPEKNCDVS